MEYRRGDGESGAREDLPRRHRDSGGSVNSILSRLLLVLLVMYVTGVHAEEPANLIANPGMEELGENGFARGWSCGRPLRSDGGGVIDRTVAHFGNHSIRLGINANSFATCTSTNITVKPKTTYFLTWWCKTEGMTQSRAYVFLQTNRGQRVLPNDSQYMTQEWTQRFGRYTTTEDETWIRPVLATQDLSGPVAYAWFDDVGIYEKGFPPAITQEYLQHLRDLRGTSLSAIVLSNTDTMTVWADNLSAKIYRDDGIPENARTARGITLSGAQGEQVYAQLVILPRVEMERVELVPKPLIGPEVIAKTQVKWWPVGYTVIASARRQDTRMGATPDPILRATPIQARKGENSPLLVSIEIPRGIKAGEYSGSISIISRGSEVNRIPLTLRVYGFSLSENPTFRTIVTYSTSTFRKWDSRPALEIEKDIGRILYAHGIRGSGEVAVADAKIEDDRVVCDFTRFDARIQWLIEKLGFSAFFLGPRFGGGASQGWDRHAKWLGMSPLSRDFNRHFPEYMRQVGVHLREKGWLDLAYLYLWDEPEQDYFDKVVALQKLALQGDTGLRIFETTSPNYEAFWGVVKAWSVPFARPYFSEVNAERRRQAGDELWVYNIPATLEAASQIHRLWFWQAAKYGATGGQLWQTTFYNGIDPWEEITPKPYPTGRDGKGLFHYEAGMGIMIYPDKDGGLPHPSLRLKLVQKGIDDYGYLAILERRLTEAGRREGRLDPQGYARGEVRRIAGTLVRDIGDYVMDTNKLEATRDRIAREIERLAAQ